MKIEKQSNSDFDKVAEMIGEIKFAMLTTLEADGAMRSRPLSTLEMDAHGQLWFFTSMSSPKMSEIREHTQVSVNYMRPDRQDYVSISGTAEAVRDTAKMKALWTPWIKPWFPQGLDDPDLVLLKVSIDEAEYWDAPGNAVMRAYGLAKAMTTGNKEGLGENRKLNA